MRTFAKTALAALLIADLFSAPALAGPPYQTDDPEPTAYRNYEIYLFGEIQTTQKQTDATPLALEVNYGLLRNLQFSVTVPYAFSDQDDTNITHSGFGDTEVALKYRFIPETKTSPQIAFYPSVTLATGKTSDETAAGKGSLFLPLWAQKDIGKWTVFGGGGALLNGGPAGQASWSFGIAATRPLSDRTSLGFELFHSGAQSDSPAQTNAGVGWTHDLGAYHGILFSAGTALQGPSSFHAYGAYEWRLGPGGGGAGR